MDVTIEIGLSQALDNGSITFLYFIGTVLLAAIGLRFSFYALGNRRATSLESQAPLWNVLVLVGVTGMLYAILALVEVVTSIRTPYRQGLILAHVLTLAVVLRLLYRNVVPAARSEATGSSGLPNLWPLAAGVVVVVFGGLLVFGERPAILALEGVAGLIFTAVGFSYGHRGMRETRVQGTVVDTLLRHLLPVLLFASMVPIADLAVLADRYREIVLLVQIVFVLMAATALMTATIKLRQNLAGL